MQHPPYHHSPGYRNRRRHRPLEPIVLQPGHVEFRVLCHDSIVGGLIGRSGYIISQIRLETGCSVRCNELVQGSDHRVILIVGPSYPCRRIALTSVDGDDEEGMGLVSVALEAVIKVCERMWAVEAQSGGGENRSGSERYCGLLADKTQIGVVVGRGGKNVLRMKRESGAQIRILPAPLCAAKDDELIQITGDMLAVKRALVAVTECLHDCPPLDKDRVFLARTVETASHMPSCDPHEEFFPHLSPLLPPLTGKSPCSHPLLSDAEEGLNQDMKTAQQEVLFRLLCSNGAAGSIIGKRGSIVRTLQNETGASIMFAPPITTSSERIVTISALENLESWYSSAQNAVILVFARSVEHDIEKGHILALGKGTTVTARLLVASDVVCCLHEGGGIDSKMTESGADIQILEGNPMLGFSLENDVVIEISGEYKNVQNALFLVTRKLRENLLPSDVLNVARTRKPPGLMELASSRMQQPTVPSLDSDWETSLTTGMDQLGLSSCLDSTVGIQSPQKSGLTRIAASKIRENSLVTSGSTNGQLTEATFPGSNSLIGKACNPNQESILTAGNSQPIFSNNIGCTPQVIGHPSPESLPSRKKYPIMANTILEFIITEDMLGSVYGEDGSNMTRLKQISGAKVEVRDPSPGKSERMIVISGTPDQVRAAQSLLQAFILAG